MKVAATPTRAYGWTGDDDDLDRKIMDILSENSRVTN